MESKVPNQVQSLLKSYGKLLMEELPELILGVK
jgi:hypothetical protein